MSGAINVSNLSFAYKRGGTSDILNDICFDVQNGEIIMILGPNGSGKTTLLKCMVSLLPYRGTVSILSKNLGLLPPKARGELAAYVPQHHSATFPYKVIDVVVSGRTAWFGMSGPRPKDFSIAKSALETIGLSRYADRPYTQLSGGELRLVFLARALAQQSRILFLDEPTSNLDIKNRIKTLKILKQLSGQGKTMVLTEHDPNLAVAFSSRLLLMKHGKILEYGPADKILTRELLQKVYDVEIEIIRKEGRIRAIHPQL